jgi:hypothetical protein
MITNEELKTFIELNEKDRQTIINAFISDDVDMYDPTHHSWYPVPGSASPNSYIMLNGIYRTIHRKKMDIPWDMIRTEFNCAAMDEDGKIYLYSNAPSRRSVSWAGDMNVQSCRCPLKIDTTGIEWRHSLVWRPGHES